tara:strand:- start:371 stop:601 length:231 start_codon:yes stop_codon:yes gene_type:complete
MNFKKLFGLSLFIGGFSSLFFGRKKRKFYQGRQDYTRQPSDKNYVDVDVTDSKLNYTHPNSSSKHDNVIRSPDYSA